MTKLNDQFWNEISNKVYMLINIDEILDTMKYHSTINELVKGDCSEIFTTNELNSCIH